MPSVRAPHTCTTGSLTAAGSSTRLWESSVTDAPASAISPRRLEAATKRLKRSVMVLAY